MKLGFSYELRRGLAVLLTNILLDLIDGKTLFVHFTGVNGNALANRAFRAMLILKAKQIVLMAEMLHAPAIAG